MEKATHNAQNEEFKNFEGLTRKLLTVPKKELDEQMASYRKKKGKSKKSIR